MDNNGIIKDELVGRNVIIKKCTDPNWINVSGKIIDETRNTFLIEIGNQKKRIAKNIAIFEFEYDRRKTVVEGSRLLYRPEDRIKKAR
ncbi:MAG: ribonuclease P protein subunit [Thermoplasmatales archaeon]|nr:MAG: ribonuclease P protein subunit [Thermoplasmatales archaeon]